jgi:hypothetical protein
MTKVRFAFLPLFFGIIFFALPGCYRSPWITWYAPHVYKGSDDPLRAKLRQADLQENLEIRFRKVQTDR